jgi:CheY-like chemotaxis protein
MPDLPGLVAEWALTAHDEVLRIRARRGLDLVSAPIWDVEGAACLADGTLPVVTSLHSTYRLVLPSKRKWQEDAAYRRLHVDKLIAAERWMLDRSRMILANSAAILRDMEAAYGMTLDSARVRLVPHGLPQEFPATPPQRDAGCRILFVGRFETRKGIDILAAAIPRVLDLRPEAYVVLVGDPDVDEDGRGPTHRAAVEALVARYPGRVEMTGVLPREALVVEDNLVNQTLAVALLKRLGIVATVVDNGARALEQLEARRWDIVLMDCQMPVMDGFEAVRRWREIEADRGLPRTPVIALTANAMEGDRERCLSCGMDDYLSKPIDRAALAEVMASRLG